MHNMGGGRCVVVCVSHKFLISVGCEFGLFYFVVINDLIIFQCINTRVATDRVNKRAEDIEHDRVD